MLVYPACLEEAVRVVCLERVTLFVDYVNRLWLLCPLEHVVCELHNAAWECRLFTFREICALEGLVVLVSLELSAPKTSEIHKVVFAILKDADIHAVAASDRVWLRNEWSLRAVCDCNSDAEDVALVLQWEVHVVLSVLLLAVIVPHLASCPWNVLELECATVVDHFTVHRIVSRQYVIVLHHILVAVVVLDVLALPVVGRVDVHAVIEDVY